MKLLPVFFMTFWLSTSYLLAQSYQRGEVIVAVSENTSLRNFILDKKIFSKNDIKIKETLSTVGKIYLLEVDTTIKTETEWLAQLKKEPTIRAAQLNYLAEYRQIPNDPLWIDQWNMAKIGAEAAWNVTTGGISPRGDTIVVLILDSGVDIHHEDLQNNIWKNRGEIPNDGSDNDGNGYTDDFFGWSLSSNSDNHLPHEHGTPVAGIIGAEGNNEIGLAGVNWQVKLMVFSIAPNQLTTANIVKGFDYGLQMRLRYNNSQGAEGAYVVAANFSGGINNAFAVNFPVWCSMYDLMGEAGIMGIGSTSNQATTNVETDGDMPSTCTSDFLVIVTDTNEDDTREGAFGVESVDIAAPGSGCVSVRPIDNYGGFGGTSCAAPHVAGAVALMHALPNELFGAFVKNNPSESVRLLKNLLLWSSEPIVELEGKIVSGGRLDLSKSFDLLSAYFSGYSEKFLVKKIYPNPVEDAFRVDFQAIEGEKVEVQLFDATGKLVQAGEFVPPLLGFKTFEMDVSTLASGMYFFKVKSGRFYQVLKIVVY